MFLDPATRLFFVRFRFDFGRNLKMLEGFLAVRIALPKTFLKGF